MALRIEIRKQNDGSLKLNVLGSDKTANLQKNKKTEGNLKGVRLRMNQGDLSITNDNPISDPDIKFRFLYQLDVDDDILVRAITITEEKSTLPSGHPVQVARIIGEDDYRNMVYGGTQGVGFIIDKSDISVHQEYDDTTQAPYLVVCANL